MKAILWLLNDINMTELIRAVDAQPFGETYDATGCAEGL